MPFMSSFYQLDFERPIRDLEQQIEAVEARLKAAAQPPEVPPGVESSLPESGAVSPAALREELAALTAKHDETLGHLYENLTPWNTVRVARHPARPQTRDYIQLMCRDFAELQGDRRFGDDPAIVTGFCRIES